MTRPSCLLFLQPTVILLLGVLAQPAAAQARTGCFTLIGGDPSGWGSMTQVCPTIDRPRDPRRVRLR